MRPAAPLLLTLIVSEVSTVAMLSARITSSVATLPGWCGVHVHFTVRKPLPASLCQRRQRGCRSSVILRASDSVQAAQSSRSPDLQHVRYPIELQLLRLRMHASCSCTIADPWIANRNSKAVSRSLHRAYSVTNCHWPSLASVMLNEPNALFYFSQQCNWNPNDRAVDRDRAVDLGHGQHLAIQ